MRVDLVVRAFLGARRHPGELAAWRLVVAGTGTEELRIRKLAAGESAVEFTGDLGPAALHRLLRTATVAVSVPVSDGTSAALLEAMAVGVQPLVNDLPANRQWVDESVGVLVPRDPTAGELAEAIGRAVARPVGTALLRSRVKQTCWEDQIESLVARYDRLSATSRLSGP